MSDTILLSWTQMTLTDDKSSFVSKESYKQKWEELTSLPHLTAGGNFESIRPKMPSAPRRNKNSSGSTSKTSRSSSKSTRAISKKSSSRRHHSGPSKGEDKESVQIFECKLTPDPGDHALVSHFLNLPKRTLPTMICNYREDYDLLEAEPGRTVVSNDPGAMSTMLGSSIPSDLGGRRTEHDVLIHLSGDGRFNLVARSDVVLTMLDTPPEILAILTEPDLKPLCGVILTLRSSASSGNQFNIHTYFYDCDISQPRERHTRLNDDAWLDKSKEIETHNGNYKLVEGRFAISQRITIVKLYTTPPQDNATKYNTLSPFLSKRRLDKFMAKTSCKQMISNKGTIREMIHKNNASGSEGVAVEYRFDKGDLTQGAVSVYCRPPFRH